MARPVGAREDRTGGLSLRYGREGVLCLVVGSVQRRFVFVFVICVRSKMLVELLALPVHHFKNTLAGQFGFASALTEPNPRVFF